MNNNLKMKKREAWSIALGIHKINNFKPDKEYKELIKKQINGEITTEDIIKHTISKYKI
nr:antitoxin VbhA family protein [Sedimentibacter sp.]